MGVEASYGGDLDCLLAVWHALYGAFGAGVGQVYAVVDAPEQG